MARSAREVGGVKMIRFGSPYIERAEWDATAAKDCLATALWQVEQHLREIAQLQFCEPWRPPCKFKDRPARLCVPDWTPDELPEVYLKKKHAGGQQYIIKADHESLNEVVDESHDYITEFADLLSERDRFTYKNHRRNSTSGDGVRRPFRKTPNPLDFEAAFIGARKFAGCGMTDAECKKKTKSETARAIARRDKKRRAAQEFVADMMCSYVALSDIEREKSAKQLSTELGISRAKLYVLAAKAAQVDVSEWWLTANDDERRDFQYVASLFNVEVADERTAAAAQVEAGDMADTLSTVAEKERLARFETRS